MEKIGNLRRFIQNRLDEKDDQIKINRDEYQNREQLKREVNKWVRDNLFSDDKKLFVKITNSRQSGHSYKHGMYEVESIDILLNDRHVNSTVILDDQDNATEIIYANMSRDFNCRMELYDDKGLKINKMDTVTCTEFEVYVELDGNIYYVSDLKRKISEVKEKALAKQKELEELDNQLGSYDWVLKYMQDNKINKELKSKVHTDMILSLISEKDADKESLETNINEILSINV